jgi:hypothetical protein
MAREAVSWVKSLFCSGAADDKWASIQPIGKHMVSSVSNNRPTPVAASPAPQRAQPMDADGDHDGDVAAKAAPTAAPVSRPTATLGNRIDVMA